MFYSQNQKDSIEEHNSESENELRSDSYVMLKLLHCKTNYLTLVLIYIILSNK